MEKKLLISREKPSDLLEENGPLLKITMMNGGWEQKVWGTTRCLCRTRQMAIHQLYLETPGSFCSIHRHQHRTNTFVVVKGYVRIVVRMYGRDHIYTLQTRESLSVPEEVLHQFQVIEQGTELLEIYLPVGTTPVDDDDIIRQHPGGKEGVPITRLSHFLVSKERAS